MKLPHAERAVIPKSKVLDSLLSASHPHGRHKAAFFNRFGFTSQSWKKLASALMRHAISQEVAETEDTRFGTRYTVEGELIAPDGEAVVMRSVWFIDKGEYIPRLVTAYPLERKKQ